jgi:hypothetical protein
MATMKREDFLTVRWNNWLSVGLGLPTLVYVVIAVTTSFWSGLGGLVGLAIFGSFF